MALFSRRKNSPPADVPDEGIEPGEQPVDPEREGGNPPAEADAPQAPAVGISVSSFRGMGAGAGAPTAAPVSGAGDPGEGTSAPEGAPAAAAASGSDAPDAPRRLPPRRPVPAEAPEPTSTVPGLRDNTLLVQALAGLSPKPTGPELMNVVRQLLQGHLFLRVQGDARELLSAGKSLPLSVAAVGDDRYVLAYSGGAALQASVRADGDVKTSAMGQPVLAVLRHVLSGDFAGLILDNNSGPARAVLPTAVLQRAVDDADEALRIKTLLSAPRTDATASEVVLAMTEAPLWVAVQRTHEGGPFGVAETRTAEGERYLEVFSHPLESVALDRGDAAAPIPPARLATALARDPQLTGVLVNPAGPWIRLSRADLAPLLALAE